MTAMRSRFPVVLFLALGWASSLAATFTRGDTLEEDFVDGPNFGRAGFRLWVPPGVGTLRAALVLVPGSNVDGRAMADETSWRAFATRHQLAVVACHFVDKPHARGFIEEYIHASRGTGQVLLEALQRFARQSRHPELDGAPLLLWGMSAGGEFNYEFAAWRPDRVIAFVVNKGGIYYSALMPEAARAVPALLFAGGQDLAARTDVIKGLFALNRRAGALWALSVEPAVGHAEGRSRALSLLFFEDVLSRRLAVLGMPLQPLDETSGYLGHLATHTVAPAGSAPATGVVAAWLPTQRVAQAWQSITTNTSPDDSVP